MLKLTAIHTRWSSDHSERFEKEVYVNPHLVQYVQTPFESDSEEETTGPVPRASVGFGIEMSFDVLESVEDVVAMIDAELRS